MTQAVVSWSGGKDCTLAAYRAAKYGLEVCGLLNMVREDGQRSWSHGMDTRWLELQSQAMGIRLIQRRTSSRNYESEFENTLRTLKQEGVSAGVFGDIDFEEHRLWVTRVCEEGGIAPVLPLWGEDQDKLVREFTAAGFEAIVVATQAELLGEEWLGRSLNEVFLADLAALGGGKRVTPCGEAGEYHTLVVNGPLFKKRLNVTQTEKVLRDGYWFLDIKGCELRGKGAD